MSIIKITTTKTEFPKLYLMIWNGTLGLTDKEVDVFSSILDKRRELSSDGLQEPYLSELLFSTRTRKELCDRLGVSSYNFQNILGHLVSKRVLHKHSNGYVVDERLVPRLDLTFKFIIKE
jgi:hypothetical protein